MTQLTATIQPSVQSSSWPIASDLRSLAIRALRRMYLPDVSLFCHCVRRTADGDFVEGVSHRYTAMTLIGLLAQREDITTEVLGPGGLQATTNRLLDDVPQMNNLGDVALSLWMASAQKHNGATAVLEHLRTLDPVNRAQPTVEVAWALTALSVAPDFLTERKLADQIAERLLASFNPQAGLFPHWLGRPPHSGWRSHVTCFADWVYPVQALSHYSLATNLAASREIVKRSAEAMCRLQGAGGQWWWHYDVRSGQIVEPYPVYSVHQDAMAPMALFAAEKACGINFDEAIQRSLDWLVKSPERGDSLIDRQTELIWRKVARHEPRKWARGIQAFASRLHSSLRVPGLDMLLAPTAIDFECRPYHLGWYLYAFPDHLLNPTKSNREIV